MSRHGYTDHNDDPLALGRWRAQVKNTIRSKRGQTFLLELAAAMDAMPERVLIANELIDSEGSCCTIGVVCAARNIDVSTTDPECPESVANLVGIAHQMAAEIEYVNDDVGSLREAPEKRWTRMRAWVRKQIIEPVAAAN